MRPPGTGWSAPSGVKLAFNCSESTPRSSGPAENGWDTHSYLGPTTRCSSVSAVIEEYCGDIAHLGIDGCGAPVAAVS